MLIFKIQQAQAKTSERFGKSLHCFFNTPLTQCGRREAQCTHCDRREIAVKAS